jgi:DNA primase
MLPASPKFQALVNLKKREIPLLKSPGHFGNTKNRNGTYGETVYYCADEENQQPVTYGDYIIEELEKDNLTFNNPVHALMFQEYKIYHKQENFNAGHFFLYNQNGEISTLTADLITEKYTLSRIHSKIKKVQADSERLRELVPRVVYEFKNSLFLEMIKQKLMEMKVANDAKNNELVDKIMKEMSQLESVKEELSKRLGERIILKF